MAKPSRFSDQNQRWGNSHIFRAKTVDSEKDVSAFRSLFLDYAFTALINNNNKQETRIGVFLQAQCFHTII